LLAIYDNCDSLYCVNNTLYNLFSDDNNTNAYVFSTVHKAKGLESEVVYILNPELFPLRRKNQSAWELEQELNIKYVAYTRSKNKLIEVNIPKK
jgi:superfamily I DNA/RNA helicase